MMQNKKSYLVSNVRTLLNLDEDPYQLADSTILDKFINSNDQQYLTLLCLPSKQIQVVKNIADIPNEGTIIHISKMRSNPTYFNFSIRPSMQFKYLEQFAKSVCIPILSRQGQSNIMDMKQLQSVIENTLKVKSLNESDVNFNTFEEELDFWQDQDIEKPSERCSFFLREYASISKTWRNLQDLQLSRMASLVDTTWSVLNKIWNSPYDYHEKRIIRLLEVIQNHIINKIKSSFTKESQLLAITFDIKQRLVESTECCNKFITLSHYYSRNTKRKLLFKPKLIQQFSQRITATYRLKTKIEILKKLHDDKKLSDNPQNLMMLIKFDNFLNNSLLKANPKVISKVQQLKTKLKALTLQCTPIIQQDIQSSLNQNNIQYAIKTLQKWYYFFSQPQVMEATNTLQDQAIRKITQHFQYVIKESTKQLQNKNYSGQLSISINLHKKLNHIHTLITQFASNSQNYPTYIKKYQKHISNIETHQNDNIKQFINHYETLLNDKTQNSSKILGKLVIEMSYSDQKRFTYTVSEDNIEFIREMKKILELNYIHMIPQSLLKAYEEAKKMNKQNIYLQTLQSRYNNIENKLQIFHRSILQKQLRQLRDIMVNPKMKKKISPTSFQWKDQQQISHYIDQFTKYFDKLTSYLKLFNQSQLEIQQIAEDLLNIEYSKQNIQIINIKIEQVNRIIQNSSGNREALEWKNYWKNKLTKIIGVIWNEALVKGIKGINININTILINNSINYQPQISQIKQMYYKEINEFVGWPATNHYIDGHQVISGGGQQLAKVYENIETHFDLLQSRKNKYSNVQKALNLDVDSLEEKLNKEQISSDQLANLLMQLKSTKEEVDLISDEDKLQSFIINNMLLKQSLKDIIDDNIEAIINLIKYSIKIESEQVEDYMNNAFSKLQNKPKNMNEMGQAINQYDKIRESETIIQQKIKKIEYRNNNIRQITGVSFNTSNMVKRWQNFQIASNQMNRVLDQQKNRLQEQTLKKGEIIQLQVQKLYKRYLQIKPKNVTDNVGRQEVLQLYEKIKDWQSLWHQIEKKYEELLVDIKYFKMKPPNLNTYNQTKAKLKSQLGNWSIFIEYRKQLQKIENEQWITFRGNLNKYGQLINEFSQKIKNSQSQDYVLKFLRQMQKENRQGLVILRCVTGQNFEKEHWGMLFSILKIKNVSSVDKLLFSHLLESNLISKANQIRQLQSRARGQISIRDALGELEAWCITREFELTDYNSMGRVTSLIKQWKDIITEVSDHQSLVLSIKESKYSTRFKSEIQKYQEKFGMLDDALIKLNLIQRKWIYLQPIFMRGALPNQQGRWKRLDEEYRNIMNNVANNRQVIELTNIAGFKDTLNNITIQLERCQKALNDYLEQKRNKFPRFYFLGDDDMLQILGQSQNPAIIQQHLKKLFSGIHSVKFNQKNQKILAMKSSLGEQVKLDIEIEVNQVVQNWLQQLSKNMVDSLKKLLKIIRRDQLDNINGMMNGNNFFNKYPSQIICLNNQIKFNLNCCQSIPNRKLKDIKNYYTQLLGLLTKKCHQNKEQLLLAKIKSFILDIIHQISIIDLLINKNINNIKGWIWYKQLTFFEKDNGVAIKMANTNFDYTFEYQGNAQKLVYSPLTDKCYLTLTQAMFMGLGGNPYGPAGTGKTESVKALALAFGRQVLVFNCDQGLDFQSMGRIFMGLVKCGAWGCFDQFNRLLEEQLSAISQQIQIIQQSIKARQRTIHLLGKTLDVNFNSAIFVTLNPAGKGYGGRSKLPDNLKQLFRPVAMSVPDNQLIAEVLLFAQGFNHAKIIAEKIITVFTLCKQLLSKQLHYDWGLRALKTILTVAGRLIFQEKKDNLPEQIESEILIKALRINTISKLTFNDLLKFNVLVKDVFPGVNIKDIVYEGITQAVKKVFSEENFEVMENQLNKILQFYEATKQRIGVVLVGPSGCGKTTIWKTLKKCYEELKQSVKVHLINPKAMARTAFLGYMNNDTRQFSEGVLTSSARQVVKEESSVLNWIICDGDIDPEWIEALNSVLDDNHLLTLPTGERISFGSNVNFIFETHNLQFASPATISRMGMIFMNEEDINIKSIISKWWKGIKQDNVREAVARNISIIEDTANKIYQMSQKQIVSTTKVGLVRNVLSMLEISESDEEFKLNLVKGLSTNFQVEQRVKIFQIVYNKPIPGNRDPLLLKLNNGKLGEFKDEPISQISRIYLTKNIKKDISIVSNWLKSGHSFIIVGKEGCGKSLLLEASIAEIEQQSKCKITTIHCNRQTKSLSLINKLFQSCQKVTTANGKTLKPLNCHRQIIVLKQVNLPKPDKYNTIELITFIQSLITHEGFYDQNLQFVGIGEGIQFVCIMKPATTLGRYQLTTRFVSNMRILAVDYQSIGTEPILRKLSEKNSQDIQTKINKFWEIVNNQFRSDDNAHYLFSPRNLNWIVQSISNYEIDMNNSDEINCVVYHEMVKQFGDRLVSKSQKDQFYQHLKDIFGKTISPYYYINPNTNKLKPIDKNKYINLLNEYIKLYQSEVKQVNLILVDEVINLMDSIERKLVERGSLLMAGETGCLRKTVLRIQAHKHKIPIYTLSNIRNPTLKDLYKDLRGVMQIAGGQNKVCILFLEEHQLSKNEFYQKVNSLISCGEIAGLFNADQIEGIVNDAEKLRSQYFGKSLYECFIERIKKNLIIVLSLDHRNKSFYEVCSSNPAFYSSCRFIWLNCYSKKSLEQIAEKSLQQLKLQDYPMIGSSLVEIHQGSSKMFINLLNNFKNILSLYKANSANKLDKLLMGLEKLNQTEKIVNELTTDAIKKKKLLSAKQKEADESLNEITEAMREASGSKQQAQTLQEFLEKEEVKISKDKDIVQQQLSRVQPLIDQAKNSVSNLSKKNIENIRAFLNPPEAVKYVLKAVLTIFGNKDQTWNSMKNFLKICKEKILYFDIRDMNENMRVEVQKIIAEHQFYFQRENVFKASQQAVPLRDWVVAIIEYSKTYEKIRPLQENLNKIMKQLSRSRVRLTECSQKVVEMEKKVSWLNQNFVRKTNQAEVLKQQLVKAENAMQSGQQLLGKLKDEKIRWEKDSSKLKLDVQMLPRYTALTASFVTYLSESAENVRLKKLEQWKKTIQCHYYNFLNFVINEAHILIEVSKGLPNDQLSIENSQIIRIIKNVVPLIIDPQVQASLWLKNKLANEGSLDIIQQQDQKFINTLELGIRFGKIIIIQEVDYIESILVSILKGDYNVQGSRQFLQIGQKTIDINESFRIYLTTRNTSLDIPYHFRDLINIVNFSVTRSGLQSKLLSNVISYFQPEIEKQKETLLHQQEKLKINLSELQEKLLKQLADSSGNILENKSLINSLNQTKQQSQIVTQSLQQSQSLQDNLQEKRKVFLPIAQVAARIYIALSFLTKLNPMYRYNLKQFIGFFEQALTTAPSQNTTESIQLIKQALVQIVYDNISVGLLKIHRVILGIIVMREVLEHMMPQRQVNGLIGNMVGDDSSKIPKWVDEKQKQKFGVLMKIVGDSIKFSDRKWQQWCHQRECEEKLTNLNELTQFQQVLLVNAVRPDRLLNCVNKFVMRNLQLTNLSGIELNMKMLVETKMNKTTPCLFIISLGFDPSKQIQEYANAVVGRDNFVQISMGGNQNDYILDSIRQASKKGGWVCLKNLHLVISFATILEKQLLSIEQHQNFRLFLTTESHHKFPPILLESCYKVSYEAPPGLKKNFLRLLSTQLETKNNLMTILTYFHALIQQRRNYIPQGWSKFYEFNYGDYKAGSNLITQISKNIDYDWDMLYGIMVDSVYGGRIDNDVDMRLMNSYVRKYFNDTIQKGSEGIYKGISVKNKEAIIQKLPQNDNPEIYGLPLGIDKAIERIKARQFIDNLKVIISPNVEEKKFSREDWKANFQAFSLLWKGIITKIQQSPLKQITTQKLKSVDPIQSFVYGQMSEAILTLKIVKGHMQKLQGVLYGNDLLTSQLQQIGKIVLKGQTPAKWTKIWQGPDAVTEWLKLFAKKYIAMGKWVDNLERGSLLQQQLDLADVFRPQIFFNAFKQKIGRSSKIPINQLKIKCSFSNPSETCVKIKNVVVQGCSLGRDCLAESSTDDEYQDVPCLYIFYNQKPIKQNEYLLPFYTDFSRSVLLGMVPVGVQGNIESKIISSSAFLVKQS